tara:strand:- start:126 stop:1190 length:1065 start_codon:yes stop_codon:yes gene_type:complete
MSLIISTIVNTFFENINKNPAFLTCPNGNLLLYETIRNIDLQNIHNVFLIMDWNDLRDHFQKDDLQSLFSIEDKHVELMFVSETTKNYPTTIYNCIKKYDIQGAIYIKDYKTIIKCCPNPGNFVYFFNYENKTCNMKLCNKSFINLDNLSKITNISEKNIISNKVCVGLYSFEHAEDFIKNYENISKIENIDNHINVSHVIYSTILNGALFYGKNVNKYVDVTYYDDWIQFCSRYKTLFVDIDGVLVFNSGEYSTKKWGETQSIEQNVKFLNRLYDTGTIQIILTTARKSKFKEKTIQQLQKYNIPYDTILFDLYHCKRYIINDFSSTNPFPSAIAINLSRDNSDLASFFPFLE